MGKIISFTKSRSSGQLKLSLDLNFSLFMALPELSLSNTNVIKWGEGRVEKVSFVQ